MNNEVIVTRNNVHIVKVEIPNVKGLFMCTSFRFYEEDREREHARPTVSFLVISEDNNTIVDWEVTNGPITKIERCDENWVSGNSYDVVKPHWYFPFCKGFGNWTQCAVSERRLPQAVQEGNYEYVKRVLSEYLDDYKSPIQTLVDLIN